MSPALLDGKLTPWSRLWLLLLPLSGCTPAPLSDTAQVLAKVGTTEITALQYEYTLNRMGLHNPTPEVQQEVMQKLIDRELAVQQAERLQLDRQPEWVLAQAEARRDLMAKAYADQLTSQAEKPDENQLLRFYHQHPELFEARRIYHLQEAAIPANLPQLAELRRRLEQGQEMGPSLVWLHSQGVEFHEQAVIRAAEQLPLEIVPRLQQAKAGETLFFSTPRGVLLYQIISLQSAPIAWEQARPLIADHLAKQTGKIMLESELSQLRHQTPVVISAAPIPASTGNSAKATP